MKKKLILAIVAVLFALTANAQKALKKVYNENINPIEQIDQAVFEYIHVNYNPRKSQGEEKLAQGRALMKRLNNAGRFGYPVFVVLDEEGRILHIQDSGLLEEGEGYNQKKVLSFFKNWTPKAVRY